MNINKNKDTADRDTLDITCKFENNLLNDSAVTFPLPKGSVIPDILILISLYITGKHTIKVKNDDTNTL